VKAIDLSTRARTILECRKTFNSIVYSLVSSPYERRLRMAMHNTVVDDAFNWIERIAEQLAKQDCESQELHLGRFCSAVTLVYLVDYLHMILKVDYNMKNPRKCFQYLLKMMKPLPDDKKSTCLEFPLMEEESISNMRGMLENGR
jgi:hypothetical protein